MKKYILAICLFAGVAHAQIRVVWETNGSLVVGTNSTPINYNLSTATNPPAYLTQTNDNRAMTWTNPDNHIHVGEPSETNSAVPEWWVEKKINELKGLTLYFNTNTSDVAGFSNMVEDVASYMHTYSKSVGTVWQTNWTFLSTARCDIANIPAQTIIEAKLHLYSSGVAGPATISNKFRFFMHDGTNETLNLGDSDLYLSSLVEDDRTFHNHIPTNTTVSPYWRWGAHHISIRNGVSAATINAIIGGDTLSGFSIPSAVAPGASSVNRIIAGTGISVSPASGEGAVTITATGGGGSGITGTTNNTFSANVTINSNLTVSGGISGFTNLSGNASAATNLTIANLSLSGVSTGDVVRYNGTNWIPTGVYVGRPTNILATGGINGYDWEVDAFTHDGTWRSIALPSFVPMGAKSVNISWLVQSTTVNTALNFAQSDQSVTLGYISCRVFVVGTFGFAAGQISLLGTNRNVWYYSNLTGTNNNNRNVYAQILGWSF